MKIRTLASARQDLIEGYRFYEAQSQGIGTYFLDSLYSDIESLQINAGIHPKYFGTYFRLLSKRFPFAIYYRVIGSEALVYAVLDCRRRPAWNRQRFD